MGIVRGWAVIFALLAWGDACAMNGVELDKKYSAFEHMQLERSASVEYLDATYLIGYVAAITDMLVFEKKICLPAGITSGQITGVVGKQNRSMPSAWQFDGSTIVLGALLITFPCAK
jgi:hypothetical protein